MSALTDRDVNAQPTSNPSNTEQKAGTGEENGSKESQQSKQLFQQIVQNNAKPGQSYISPSDAILSPASKKLSNFKQKQINKQSIKTPAARTLFARTTSSCSNGSDNVDTGEEKA